jgi:phage shock protein C
MAKEEEPKIRKLYRSSKNKWLFGVCGGFGEYFGIDPMMIRLAFVLLTLTGPGLPFYIIAWLMMPKAPEEAPAK